MNIEENIMYCVFFYNRILVVVPLCLDFLKNCSHLFSFVSEEKKSIIFAPISQRFSSILEEIKKKVILSCLVTPHLINNAN